MPGAEAGEPGPRVLAAQGLSLLACPSCRGRRGGTPALPEPLVQKGPGVRDGRVQNEECGHPKKSSHTPADWSPAWQAAQGVVLAAPFASYRWAQLRGLQLGRRRPGPETSRTQPSGPPHPRLALPPHKGPPHTLR